MSKPLYIVATDIHITADNIDKKKQYLLEMCEKSKELKCEDLLLLGDIFDSRKGQPQKVLNGFTEILLMLNKYYKSILIIAGNHCKSDYCSERSYLDEYQYHPNTKIVDNYYHYKNLNLNHYYHFIPYFEEETTYLSYLNKALEVVKENPTFEHYLFTHIGVRTFLNNSKKEVLNPVVPELFAPFKKVYIGHYHCKSKKLNIQYIGSLNPENFGEDNDKGFMVFYENGSEKYFNLKFIEYHTVTIELDAYSLEEVQNLRNKYTNFKDKIRFVFYGNKSQLNTIDVGFYQSVGIKVEKKRKDIEETLIAASNNQLVVKFDIESIKTEFNDFSTILQLEKEKFELGKQYLNKQLQTI
jgi:DNA repair exonuclease SbcCD nuclease subunit